ncbi:hypothetical protein HY009_01365 [Candidatus Acetothermia bacterium]|nr:hypothetical protein [Candidatus Acetothermia bacterium]
MPFLNQLVDRKPNPKDTVQPHSAPSASCVQSVREPERSQLLQQALADPQLQAVRTQLESRGLTMNAAGAMAVHIAAGDQVIIPFGAQAYLVWNRYQSQTNAIGLIRQNQSTLNLTASGQERWVRFLSAQEIQILLTQLRQNGTFSAFENQLHQLGKQLADARVHGFLDVTGGVASLGLATVDSAAGTFTHQLRVQVDTSGNIAQGLEPSIQETACNSVVAQSQAAKASAGSGNRVIAQTTVDPGGGGGGIDPGDTICTSQWGYQYRCTYTTPAFCSDGLSAPLVTFLGQQMQASITIWNCGGGILEGTATTDAPYSIVSGGSYSSQPDEPKAIVVGFSPTTSGTFAGTLHLVAGSLVYDGTLEGCTLTVSPAQLNFTAFVGSPQDLQLTVRHDGPLGTVTDPGMPSATIQLSASAPYSIISTAGNPFTLRSGRSQQVMVRFDPTDSGSSTSNVSLTATMPGGSSSSFSVSVAGLAHKLSIDPTEINLMAAVGYTSGQQVIMTNVGGTTFTFTASTSAPYSMVSPTNSVTLAPGQNQELTVQFNPTEDVRASGRLPKTFSGSVHVTSGAGRMEIPLTEVAIDPQPTQPYYEVTQYPADGETIDTGIDKTISVTNAINEVDYGGTIFAQDSARNLKAALTGFKNLGAGQIKDALDLATQLRDTTGITVNGPCCAPPSQPKFIPVCSGTSTTGCKTILDIELSYQGAIGSGGLVDRLFGKLNHGETQSNYHFTSGTFKQLWQDAINATSDLFKKAEIKWFTFQALQNMDFSGYGIIEHSIVNGYML